MNQAQNNAPEVLELEIQTPAGRLRGRLAVPPRPIRLAELTWNVMTISDRLSGLAVGREEREGRKISCRKGCGACCRQVVPLSPPEAWMIADLVAGMNEDARSAVSAAFASVAEELDRAGLKAPLCGHIERLDDLKALSLAYFQLGLACPFLSSEEACTIHPYRPSICREYMVTSPAENCAELGRKPIVRIQVAVRLSEALAALTAKLLGSEPEVIPLALALEWAAAHREEGLRTWQARTLVEALVAEIAALPGATAEPGW
ncbi:MAG: YkgJ family cysteine cluster protein [Acidobacteriota bacterium]|jgi:Fe-S-cluster containining protein